MSSAELRDGERDEFEQLLEFVRSARGFDFTGYKRPTLVRRVRKRMEALGAESFEEYRARLEAEQHEYDRLFDALLINVTGFFRDPPAWEFLAEEILPRIVEQKPTEQPIRVWSTGCATGEEAYTVAMLFTELLGDNGFRARVKIYATDVDDEALAYGRHGRYGADAVEAVPPELRDKYLDRLDGSFVFRGDLRRSVIFGRHDLLQDPPISRVDLLLARNTLMYFNAETQGRVLANLHFALNDGGYLFLGKSEMLLTRSNLFTPVDLRRRVFAPVPKVSFRERLAELAHTGAVGAGDGADDGVSHARDAAFEGAPFASLVIDRAGHLAFANRHARNLFRLGPRDLGRPFHELEVSFRPVELRSRLTEATQTGHTVSIPDVELTLPSGERRALDVQISPLVGSDGRAAGASVSVVDVTRYRELQESIERSRSDLETAYEELQATTEELETTNEELQSTNEELETTNEELQSTNEELETMNEELQSTNEELETMNDELRLRTEDLNSVNAFLDAILASLHHGVVVLDEELRVRAWNDAAHELWGVRAEEVDGEHFLNLDIGLPLDELASPLRSAVRGEVSVRELDATNRRGRSVRVRVRIAPTRALGGGAGVIVLMEEDASGPA